MSESKRSIRRYLQNFIRRFFEGLGVEAVVAAAVALFNPNLFLNQWWLIAAAAAVAIGWAIFSLRERDPQQRFPENVTIRLVSGDLFEQDASVLIGMTTTFDTEPGIIDNRSVQGSFLRVVFGGSQRRLDEALDIALAHTNPVDQIDKSGKQLIYPVGTVAVLPGAGEVRYYCAAYTSMDANNRARGSIRGILESLDAVWDAADRHGNGSPICVPLLGQGQSRVPELTAEISIRLIASSFLLRTRRGRFASELRIVVHPKDMNKVDRSEFQAFLRSVIA